MTKMLLGIRRSLFWRDACSLYDQIAGLAEVDQQVTSPNGNVIVDMVINLPSLAQIGLILRGFSILDGNYYLLLILAGGTVTLTEFSGFVPTPKGAHGGFGNGSRLTASLNRGRIKVYENRVLTAIDCEGCNLYENAVLHQVNELGVGGEVVDLKVFPYSKACLKQIGILA